jgi:hypothetical protein
MKKLILFLLFVPLVSFGQSSYSSYYENGKIKVTGESFEEIIGSKVSAKSGLNVRESHPSGGFKIPLERHIYRLRIKPPCPLGSVGGFQLRNRS